jgi:drug/metabolite transporter (DMT)-like permease
MALMLKMIIGLYVLVTASALVVLKLGAKAGAPAEFIDGRLHFNLNPYVFAGIALYGTSFLLYIYLISKYDLGYIIPLTTGLVYALIFIASFVIFNEVFTVFKIVGIALIVLGLLLLNLKK